MAVYTEVSDEDLNTFIAQYALGGVLSCKGIAEGVENSNYLLVTETGPYILTLYEKRTRRDDLPFFLGLMEHLADKGVGCPVPLHGNDGEALRELCGRPAVLVTFLNGMWPRRIDPYHCAALGEAMGTMHKAGADFAMKRPNDLSVCRLAAAVRRLLRPRARGPAGAGRSAGAGAGYAGGALARRGDAARGRDPCRPVPRQCVLPGPRPCRG